MDVGIERVVRAGVTGLVEAPPEGYRIEPVMIEGAEYVYATQFVAERMGLPIPVTDPAPVVFGPGDIFLGLDWVPDRLPMVEPWLRRFRRRC